MRVPLLHSSYQFVNLYYCTHVCFRAHGIEGYLDQLQVGASFVLPDEREASLRLASSVLESLGVDQNELLLLRRQSRAAMAEQDLEQYRRFLLEKEKNEERSPPSIFLELQSRMLQMQDAAERLSSIMASGRSPFVGSRNIASSSDGEILSDAEIEDHSERLIYSDIVVIESDDSMSVREDNVNTRLEKESPVAVTSETAAGSIIPNPLSLRNDTNLEDLGVTVCLLPNSNE